MSLPGSPDPTRDQAASLVMEASNDPGWGMFVWLALTLGAPPGELCALRWSDVDLDTAALAQRGRRVPLDPRTVTLLRAYLAHCTAQAAILGIERDPGAYMFSPSPDGATAPGLETITERFDRTCAAVGLTSRLEQLPHYSVTDLVASGVDVRSVQWRLQRGLSRIQRRPRS
jgi:integrase